MSVTAEPKNAADQLTPEQLRQAAYDWGLTPYEYERILEGLGRQPTLTEIAMFSVEWCEHCGYPKSRNVLRMFPKTSGKAEVLVGADSGGFYLTPDLAVVMKVESHNHPSQVEPYQGAATGVGGIVRDIFTCGARPIASGNSLRFGTLSDPYTRYLLAGVVHGIGGYGNSIGVPTVTGEVRFDPSYLGNCLVNAMAVGVAPKEQLLSSAAAGPGNPVLYVGSSTGRDGIGGCSVLASHEFGEGDEKRPTVQIGDPFTEKRLIEACLEAARTGWIVGMKDMGAAGVTCTTSEMAAAGGVGMRVELQNIPRREAGMEPYEVLMSESQERMLLVAQKGREQDLIDLFRKWELNASVIGEVTGDGLLTILDHGREVAVLPADFLTEPPRYDLPTEEPAYLKEAWAFDLSALKEPESYGQALLSLLASPNICSKQWVWQQYDHMVQTNTVAGPGGDAAVLRIKEAAPLGIALTMDGNDRQVYLDPYEGARLCVAEAARNLACVGADPRIVTDGLNFGNPDKPDRFYQFKEAVRGIADACRQFDLAVVSGNVSLYNESPEGAIHPTPIIGMLGVLPDVSRHGGIAFREGGDRILLVGALQPEGGLGASEYLWVQHGVQAGRPALLELELELKVQEAVRQLVREGLVQSAHDCSDGGLGIALAECCIAGGIGAAVEVPGGSSAEALFGEAPSRVLVSVSGEQLARVKQQLESAGVPHAELGEVRGDRLIVHGALDLPVAELEATWERTIPAAMGS
ncbi:MAG TPA: phosphoribosylformylglycinamidine synthase subunit PurL [Armatimonadota bacterium]|nr:phosphoribosylformylglycinamidine synthase subunit PurL [Armatimonadota bacterium]